MDGEGAEGAQAQDFCSNSRLCALLLLLLGVVLLVLRVLLVLLLLVYRCFQKNSGFSQFKR